MPPGGREKPVCEPSVRRSRAPAVWVLHAPSRCWRWKGSGCGGIPRRVMQTRPAQNPAAWIQTASGSSNWEVSAKLNKRNSETLAPRSCGVSIVLPCASTPLQRRQMPAPPASGSLLTAEARWHMPCRELCKRVCVRSTESGQAADNSVSRNHPQILGRKVGGRQSSRNSGRTVVRVAGRGPKSVVMPPSGGRRYTLPERVHFGAWRRSWTVSRALRMRPETIGTADRTRVSQPAAVVHLP